MTKKEPKAIVSFLATFQDGHSEEMTVPPMPTTQALTAVLASGPIILSRFPSVKTVVAQAQIDGVIVADVTMSHERNTEIYLSPKVHESVPAALAAAMRRLREELKK